MDFHHEKNIRLQEAMTKELDNSIRVWSVDGLKIEVKDLPENTHVLNTFVYKDPSGYYELAIMADFDENDDFYSKGIEKFSTLEELKEKYPNLFEMKGKLFSFP